MKRIALVLLTLLLGLSSSAYAGEGLSLMNQTDMSITATLTQTTSLSQPMKGNETYVFGAFPKPQYTLRIKSSNVDISKSFGADIKYASFHRAGQVFVITVSATPMSSSSTAK
jgi:hypothetical protein